MISINATLVIQVIHFLILAYILNRLLFRPVMKLMDDRDGHIEKTITRANEALDKTEVLKERWVSEVNEARKNATQERTELRETGIAETKELLERFKGKTTILRAETDKEAEKGIATARPLMHDQVVVLAEKKKKKMLGRRLKVESEN